MGKASTRAQNRYIGKNYDRINLVVPKGQKAAIQSAANGEGESLTAYIQGAILARMGLSNWPATHTAPDEPEVSEHA